MIEDIYKKTSQQKQVTCDNCGEGFEADSWEDAQDKMKQSGWKTKRVDDEWVHYCEECAGK